MTNEDGSEIRTAATPSPTPRSQYSALGGSYDATRFETPFGFEMRSMGLAGDSGSSSRQGRYIRLGTFHKLALSCLRGAPVIDPRHPSSSDSW